MLLVAVAAVVADLADARRQRLGVHGGQVREQVHGSRGRAHRQLAAGHEAQADPLGRGRCLVQAAERVVVGQRKRAQAERVRVLDQRRGRQPPVGGRRMAVEIDQALTSSSNALIVSDRSPSRSVSSGMTSSGGMLPRLTSGPNCRMNQAC